MQNYLAIVLRSKFALFYRFGTMTLGKQELHHFCKAPKDAYEQLRERLNNMTPIEYANEVLILHLQSEASIEEDFLQFTIANLQAIYPLTEQARQSISGKIDRRIRLSEAIFEDLWIAYENQRINSFHRKGADILWKLCSMEGDVATYLNRIGIDSLYKGLDERRSPTKKLGRDYWFHLIAYDRYDFFPNETIGYFYDAGDVFAQSQGQQSFRGSKLHSFLENLTKRHNKQLKFNNILNKLTDSKESQNYINQSCKEEIKLYEIAPLFFQLKEDIRAKQENLSESYLLKNINTLKKNFPDSLPYTVALLGLFFGFHTFYDLYYDNLNLHFYHTNKQTPKEPKVAVEREPLEPKDTDEYEFIIVNEIKRFGKLSIKKIKEKCKPLSQTADFYITRLNKDPRIEKVKQSFKFRDDL